jgi:hypothetical protein
VIIIAERQWNADSVTHTLLNTCTAIDIVIASPPAKHGDELVYIQNIGNLICAMKEHPIQQGVFISYLVECSSAEGNKTALMQALNVEYDPWDIHARVFAPCDRHSLFMSNIFNSEMVNLDVDTAANISTCLEKGYQHAGSIINPDQLVKAASFSPILSEVNKLSTFVYRSDPEPTKDFFGRLIKLTEQEHMMGFPSQYLSSSLQYLFHNLLTKGLLPENEEKFWRITLQPKFHHFAGAYHQEPDGYRIYCVKELNWDDLMSNIRLQMRPLCHEKCMDPEDYGKYLVALSSNIPTLEILLQPLQRIFAFHNYPAYSYPYKWQTW